MALIECPNCRQMISDKAEFCPKCNHSSEKEKVSMKFNSVGKVSNNIDSKTKPFQSWLKLILAALVAVGAFLTGRTWTLIFAVLLLAMFIHDVFSKSDNNGFN